MTSISGFNPPPTYITDDVEYRKLLVQELKVWMTEYLPQKAGGRLHQLTEKTSRAVLWDPDARDRYHACALWAFDICLRYLNKEPIIEYEALPFVCDALAFICDDYITADNLTFVDLWRRSGVIGHKRPRRYMMGF